MCPPTDAQEGSRQHCYNSLKMETTQRTINRTNKGTVEEPRGDENSVEQPMTAYSNTDTPLKQNAERNKPDTCHETLSDDTGVRSKNRHN